MSNRIERITCAGDLPGVRLTHLSGFQAVVSEYGGQVLSWTDPREYELLFVSKAARYHIGEAIRGGIPVVFPQFGSGELPKHGFARTSMWQVVREQVSADGPVSVTLRLSVSAEMYPHWPNECVVELDVALTEVLLLTLRVRNTGPSDFEFFSLLHTYFAIDDICGVRLGGLHGIEYIDLLDTRRQMVESRHEVEFSGPVDRIYRNSPSVLELYSERAQRRFMISKEGFSDSVVWNPWLEGARAIVDLLPDEYQRMVCVESGNVGAAMILQPGEEHVSTQRLRVEECGC